MKKIWDWYYGKASIRKKLIISYLILVILPILVLGMYSYYVSKKNLIRQTKHTMESNVDAISYSLQNDIQRETDNIKYLSYNAKLRGSLENGLKNRNALVKEMNDSVEPTFWYFIASDDKIKGIEIYSPYVKQSLGSFLKPLEGKEKRSWFRKNQNNFKTEWSVKDDRIYATRMILDSATSSTAIGYMRLEVFADEFLDGLFQSSYLNNGILLVDANGKKITERTIKDREINKNIYQHIEENREERIYETKKYILATSEKMDNGWKLYYYIDKSEISEQIREIMATTVLVMGLCLAVALIMMSVISKILSTRILQLKHGAEEISRGNFELKIEQGYSDEIGVVAESFREMCMKINQMMQDMYQLGLEKRKEELKALQAMMNPHFLYNCLSSIKWKAIRSDQDDIAEITGLLATFYRTALNGGRQITIVQNELENIKAYLQIQLKSHENNFDVEYQLDEAGGECQMPNFLLQPIVENAICHGADLCESERGKIKVEYIYGEEFLEFHVYNNGPKVVGEELERILNTPGKGYGIYNIRERIRMYYDEECGLYSSTTDEGMVCFSIKIRKEIENK